MGERLCLDPPASTLIYSLRSIGYSFNSAISDIVDNSIAAHAKNIDVELKQVGTDVWVIVSDDGIGMGDCALNQAMLLGSKGPMMTREPNDLGRFGMGLKTASFSQAKLLTVFTKHEKDELLAAQWDLDHVSRTNLWEIKKYKGTEAETMLSDVGLELPESGTAVVWQNCDRITEGVSNPDLIESMLGRLHRELREHMSLVFHKFINRRSQNGIKLSTCGIGLEPKDPFSKNESNQYPASTEMFEQSFSMVPGLRPVIVRGYILPHPSRIKGSKAQNTISYNGDMFNSQGFYVYRADRLLTWGDWLRMVPKNESHKLARVEIDFPNELDHIWRLDVKKSKVELPTELRTKLRKQIDLLGVRSKRTFERRPRITNPSAKPIWIRQYDDVTKSVIYRIDKNHPLIADVLSQLQVDDERYLNALVKLIELGLPVSYIASDSSANINIGLHRSGVLDEQLRLNIDSLINLGIQPDRILSAFQSDDAASQEVVGAIEEYLRELEE